MKTKGFSLLKLTVLLLVLSCEIEDDFGEFSSSDLNPAVSLAPDTQLIAWKDNENILYWTYSSSEIRTINLSNKTSTVFYQLPNLNVNETYIGEFFYFAPDQLAAIVMWHDDTNTQFKTILYLINLSNNQITKLTENLDLSTPFDIDNPIINNKSTLLAYPVRNESYLIETWLYDQSGSEFIFVGPGYPITFSPEGNKLLCYDYSSGTYLYNVTEKKQEAVSFTLSNFFNNKVRWNVDGVVEGYILNNYPTSTIQIHNLTNNTQSTRTTTFNSSYIYLSHSGKRFIDGSLSCLSPYLKVCPGLDSKVTLYMVDVKTNSETELLMARLNADQGQQFFIEKLEFSPDESRIAFTQTATLYVSQN